MKAYLSILIIFANLMCHAQAWAPASAIWHYGFSSPFGEVGFVKITVGSDTLIQGRSCTKLHKRTIGHDFVNNLDYDYSLGEEVTFDSLGLVLIFDLSENGFDTLFNLHASPGDSWTLPKRPENLICDSLSQLAVLDTGTAIRNGIPLRWLFVSVSFSPVDFAPLSYMDTLFERIGPVSSYLLSHDLCNSALDQHEGGPFRCYQDDQFSYVRDPGSSCEAPLQIPQWAKTMTQQLFPNPGVDLIFFDPPFGDPIMTVTIRDAQGALVLHMSEASPIRSLNVSHLGAGIYTVELQSRKGLLQRLKWIKQG